MRIAHIAIMMIALAGSLLAGCTPQLSPDAQKLLATGQASYQAGDDAATINSMNEFLASNPRSAEAPQAYYWRAMARWRFKDLPAAQNDLEQVVRLAPSGQLKGLGCKGLGDLAFNRGDLGQAESTYRQALANLDETKPPADEVRFRVGDTDQRLGRWREADAQFGRLVYQFAGGELARQAGRRMHANSWTVQIATMNDKRQAQALADELVAAGSKVAVATVATDSGPVFAVQSGRFETYGPAQAALENLKKTLKDHRDACVTVTR